MSKFFEQFALQGEGYEITPDAYRALREQVRADLADGRAARYFGDPAAQKRVGELFRDQEVAAPSTPDLGNLNRAARDYCSNQIAAELFSERMKELGTDRPDYKSDLRMRNQAMQKAAFRFATVEFGRDQTGFAGHMNEVTAAFATREAGRQMALGKNPSAISKMLPQLEARIQPGRQIGGQDVRWWKHDCPATRNLQQHMKDHSEKLSPRQQRFAIESGFVAVGDINTGYTQAVAKVARSAAVASRMAATLEEGSRDQIRADKLLDASLGQIRKLAEVAALRDHRGADRRKETTQLLSTITAELRQESPQVAAWFDNLETSFHTAYDEFDAEATIEAAAIDKRETQMQVYADRLWSLAAERMSNIREQDEVEAGSYTPVSPGYRPEPNFMKPDRSGDREVVKDRDYFRDLDLTPQELSELSLEEMSELRRNQLDLSPTMQNRIREMDDAARHERRLTGRKSIDDWEAIEKILTGRTVTPSAAMSLEDMGLQIAAPIIADIRAHERPRTRRIDRQPEAPSLVPSI